MDENEIYEPDDAGDDYGVPVELVELHELQEWKEAIDAEEEAKGK
jgi:hypothetical protein